MAILSPTNLAVMFLAPVSFHMTQKLILTLSTTTLKMKTFSPEEWENVPSNTANSNTSNTPSAYSNTSEDTRAKVERVLSLIEQKGIDITNGYDNWLKVGFALTSEFQEAGRGFFHRVSRQNPEYKASDTDKQYNKCLSAHGDGISIATFFQMAKDAGIDISNPKEIQKSSVGISDIWTYGSDNQISSLSKWTPNGFWMKNFFLISLPSYTTCFHLS